VAAWISAGIFFLASFAIGGEEGESSMPESEDRLQAAFRYVLETFFPRWRNGRHWSVQCVPDLLCSAEADLETKTISVARVSDSEDELLELLIHEACHPVSVNGHGQKWRNRMLKAGEIAKRLGRAELADLIEKDVSMADASLVP